MKHWFRKNARIFLCGVIMTASTGQTVHAENNNEAEVSITATKTNQYIQQIYKQISFPENGKLNYAVFEKAMMGYLNLREAGKLDRSNILSICDFSLSANVKRLWIIDVAQRKVLVHSLVSHGQGSGEEFANRFSNIPESHQSSLGFYVTGDIYTGDNGMSMRLYGMDAGYNSNAYERAIVVHGADYVSESFIQGNKRLGRSYGCPAVPQPLAGKVINTIHDGSCMFIYYPHKKYLASSYWLNKKLNHLPDDNFEGTLLASAAPGIPQGAAVVHGAPEAGTKLANGSTVLAVIPTGKKYDLPKPSPVQINFEKVTGINQRVFLNLLSRL